MYPSTYRLELAARRRNRLVYLFVSHAFVAAVTLLGSLSLFAAAINN